MTIHPGDLADDGKPTNLLPLWLRLAKVFDAIVLIPAADSYVEQVSMGVSGRSDVKSGSFLMHSVNYQKGFAVCQMVNADYSNLTAFWACLETYGGRVILTASRARTFDEAALSRITLPIYYAPFDNATRQEVGMRLLQRMEEENEFSEVRPEAKEFWKSTLENVNWNGHEVKSGKLPVLYTDSATILHFLYLTMYLVLTAISLTSAQECTSRGSQSPSHWP